MDKAADKGREDFKRAAKPEMPRPSPHGPVSQQELKDLEAGREQQAPPRTPTPQLNHPRPSWAANEKTPAPDRPAQTREERMDHIRERFRQTEGVPRTHFREAARDRR
jgi:hypothetical protein